MSEFTISYSFQFEDGEHFDYDVSIDDRTLNYIPRHQESALVPRWTRLSYQQCSNCPLTVDRYKQCPIASNLDEVVRYTKDKISYKRANVTVAAEQRSYFKEVSFQEGLFSLFGVVMAASECPHMEWLKPLVRFHLPFATYQESIFRVVSISLLRQYVSNDCEEQTTFDLSSIAQNYKNVQIINKGMLSRIESVSKGDADKNAIVGLNLLSQMFLLSHEKQDQINVLKKIFPA